MSPMSGASLRMGRPYIYPAYYKLRRIAVKFSVARSPGHRDQKYPAPHLPERFILVTQSENSLRCYPQLIYRGRSAAIFMGRQTWLRWREVI